ncbi:co-chaperone YbbN [Methylobacterium sp. WL30]|jgi:putative thioredoxin|uniref:thioredoxin family protein n=1 Tax=unclassified Methylobacterium TaxID=2615210 RepID=UPI0011C7405E|nr:MULTISPECIES: co-chaperone YbbN [unclassified Methylobacterium]MCJ2075859.1 co-chaperone YbbN [Methylobacterium sp. E-016]TXM94542.1 co-chaperone YbbN [Methylobacterium sp. WL116]TXN30785.1 co-chaperone YbbN [Methylobacterium sp. WL93]TXN50798.1 co-chaperone YbbN [Methylobacterium sp. WL119]TXN63059.1 co-chaperone YbbN [Methylobacterium sp. WL30]
MLNDTLATDAHPGGSDLIRETTTAGFRQDVIAESANRPVLVAFWSPRAPSSKTLLAVLEKLVRAAAGKVVLVKMNVDEHPAVWGQIGQQLGLQGVPAVVAIDQGRPVDMFEGALPEAQIKTFFDRLAGPSEIDQVMAEAAQALAEGDLAGASELYAAVLGQQPDNVAALAGLAKIQLDAGELENAKQVLAMVPEAKAADPGLAGIRAAIVLAEQAAALGDLAGLEAEVAVNPDAHQARFDLALGLNAGNEREKAVDHLIEIIRRDRTWNEDGARKQLLQFFEAWGPMDPAAIRGRRKLSTLLFA